jgi:serine/threonine protein phosphatase PrpC
MLTIGTGTQVGNRYPANFDVICSDPGLGLVAVADGMGAGRGSAAAGRTAMEVLLAHVRAAHPGIGPRGLRAAVAEAQQRVGAIGEDLGELAGCTLTALLAAGADEAWIVQVGDSRAYRLRERLLELLTVDHTAAWLGAVYGWYPADSEAAAAARYRLTRYIGHPARPEPDLLNIGLRPGDVLCVCTDGVAEQLSYDRLATRLGSGAHPDEIVAAVLADTLAAGGRDNASIGVVAVS